MLLAATLSHELAAQICWIRRRQEGDHPRLLKWGESYICKSFRKGLLPSQPMQEGEQGPLWDLPSTRRRWGRRPARRKCRSADRTPGYVIGICWNYEVQPKAVDGTAALQWQPIQLLSPPSSILLCFSISAEAVYFLWKYWSTAAGLKMSCGTLHIQLFTDLPICRQLFIDIGLLAVATNRDRLWHGPSKQGQEQQGQMKYKSSISRRKVHLSLIYVNHESCSVVHWEENLQSIHHCDKL